MRVLFVTPWVPSAVRPRSLGFMKLLSSEHDVRLLSLYGNRAELERASEISGWESQLVRSRHSLAVSRSVLAAITRRSMQEAYGRNRRLARELRRHVAEWRPDVVHFNVFRTAGLIHECRDVRTVLDLDEFRSDYYLQLTYASSARRRLVGLLEHRPMRQREGELLGSETELLLSAPTGDERMAFPNVSVVRTPVWSAVPRSPGREGDASPTVLFVGRLSYEANVEGLTWFMRTTWPLILKAMPGARMHVVGAGPRPQLRRLTNSPRVELFQDVEDIRMFYGAASVAIVPISRATGVQMKLIQALAMGVPTVTTRLVAALGGVTDGAQVLTADTPSEWVSAIARLTRDSETRNRLVRAGRRWYEINHAPEAVARQLATVYGS